MNKPRLLQLDELLGIDGNKNELLKEFNFKSIYEAKKQYKKSADEVYAILFKLYNKDVIKQNSNMKKDFEKKMVIWLNKQHNEKIQQDKIIKAKKKLEKVRGFTSDAIKFPELDVIIQRWNAKNNKLDKPFEMDISSGFTDYNKTFKFNNYFHFSNWFAKIISAGEGSGQNSKNYMNELLSIFDLIVINSIKIIGGGCNKHTKTDKFLKTSFYEFELFNPVSMDNNCFFKCLAKITGKIIDIKKYRYEFKLLKGKISVADAIKIITYFTDKNIEIIDFLDIPDLQEEKIYILLKDDHYFVVESFKEVLKKNISTKRGTIEFDIETRPTEKYHLIKASKTKSYILKDAITCAYVKKYKSNNAQELYFKTNEKTSTRQFVDWLNAETLEGRTYNVLAHNGGNFDFYFLMNILTEQELRDTQLQMRGITIIGINYRGHLFKDSYCFLTFSLESLSKNFKIEHGKITELIVNGNKISSTQLCFYKPDLSFDEFLELENTDTDFWEQYIKYCMYDCIALHEIWTQFTKCVNDLVSSINPCLLKSCPLMSANTIGSHSKKIIKSLNAPNKAYGEMFGKYKSMLDMFLGMKKELVRNNKVMTEAQEWHEEHNTPLWNNTLRKLFYSSTKTFDSEKYKFLCKFKRGGISHCNRAGKHLTGITGVDIASQYPASLIYARIPVGLSFKTKVYDETLFGFYHLKNLIFESSYKFKPIASIKSSGVLNWNNDNINEIFIDSYTIQYLVKNYGLKTFDVVEGLVSKQDIEADKLFGLYVNTFYTEKKNQDALKKADDITYNPALRETIKLYLNSLTGKLVEDPSAHYSLKTYNNESKYENTPKHSFNGIEVVKDTTDNEDKINEWIVTGIMVYSYSKRLLFEYIKCLPNESDDVIHVETDSIYFSSKLKEQFLKNVSNYTGSYPCMMGDDLGNLKIEKSTSEGEVAYFLGKKFYHITTEYGDITKVKGIPQQTIDIYGNKIKLVDTTLFESIYAGNEVTKTFQTLKKSLFAAKTTISSHTMTRTVRGNQEFKLYE